MKKDNKDRLFEVMGRLDKTFKPRLNENFEVEKPEMDEPVGEGSSYKAKLEEIVALAKKAYKNLPETELPTWIQDKITIAKVHLDDINNYLHTGEEHEEAEEAGDTRDMDDEEDHDVKPEEQDEKEETEDEVPENLKDITSDEEEEEEK
jgi:hypothetical protein